MVLGMPFRRAPVATCDLIQAVLGSALPEDTVLAEQAQRLKMAVALATSKPSGKEFALKCKELLKADSVGIFAVAHSASQLRNCAPLALLATSEPEYAIGADSGVSQLRTEALIHCVGAKDGASTLVACAGKCHSMHAVADAEGVVIGVVEVARSAAAGMLSADEQLLLRFVAPAAATAARAPRPEITMSSSTRAGSISPPDDTGMARGAVLGDAVAISAGGGRAVSAATEQQLQKAQLRSSHELQKAHAHAMSAAAGLAPAAVARTPSITAIGVDIGPDGSFQKALASKLLATVGGLAGQLQVEPLIRHIRQAAREVMGSEMCTVLLRDHANGAQLIGQRSEEEGGEPFVLPPHTGLAGFVAKTGAPPSPSSRTFATRGVPRRQPLRVPRLQPYASQGCNLTALRIPGEALNLQDAYTDSRFDSSMDLKTRRRTTSVPYPPSPAAPPPHPRRTPAPAGAVHADLRSVGGGG